MTDDVRVALATAAESRSLSDRVGTSGPAFRLVAAVVLAASAPLVDGATRTDQIHFALIVAFGWIPVSGALAIFGRRWPHPGFAVLNLFADLGLLVVAGVVLAPKPELYVLMPLLLVAYNTYVGGRRLGITAAVLGLALMAWIATIGDFSFDGLALAAYPLAAIGLVWLLDIAATERTQARDRVVRLHEKSDAILTGVAEAVVVTSRGGRIMQWNRAAEHTFVCPASRALNRSCHDVLGLRQDVRELDCSAGCAVLAMHAAAGTPTGSDVELWRQDAVGERQPLLATAVPVVDHDGTVVEVVHSFRDITKIKLADEAKTLFLATASHELKTPLTVIRGFSQMLLEPNNQMSDDERDVAMRAIDVRARQLTGIVDRLLLSSRIEAGHIDLTPEPTDVRPIVDEQVAALRGSTARDLTLQIENDLPLFWVDAPAFTTIVDHLLDNAVKYSPGGGTITLAVDAHDDHVELRVTDEGVGMTDDQAAQCFDRFWQAELTDVRRFGGTGIGLYIVRSLVEGMNGGISVRSRPGLGSTFTVRLLRADRLPADRREPVDQLSPGRGDRSIIREYMRQLGVRIEASE